MANSGGGGNTTQTNVLVNIGVQGQQAVTQATQQVQALNSTSQAGANINMAAPVQTLRQSLRQAQNDLQRMVALGQQNTQQFANTAARVAQLRNDIDETNNSIKAFDPDNKFKVFANFASAGAKAIQGYAGAMAFLGVEGEDYAKTLAKLQGLMAFTQAVDSLGDIKDSFKDLGRLLGLTTTQTVAQTTATAANTTANAAQTTGIVAQATATQGATVATQAATVSTNAWGAALKAVGIGIIIAALVTLYYNFDRIKKGIDDLFPGLGGIDKLFGKLVNSVYGVGAAVKKVFTGLATAIGDLLSGNFSKIGEDLKNAFDVSDAFRQGVAEKIASDAEDAKIVRIKKEIETNERLIKERKALGEDTFKLEVQNQRNKIAVLDKDDKDYKKKKADAESDLTVLINGEEKKRSDKAKEIAKAKVEKEKAQRQSDLAEIKKNNDDALKVLAEGSKNERDSALADLDIKYKKEFDLLQKRKQDLKDYNLEFKNLTDARKNEEAKVNKKYNDQINDYLKGTQSDIVSTYDKAIADINKAVDEQLKQATPEQVDALEASRNDQINKQRDLKVVDAISKKAETDLVDAENANRPNEKDTPDEATAKINNLAKAKFDAENAAFELKKVQLEGQQDEIALLTANHQKTLTDNEEANAKARKDIAEAEKKAKLATYEQVGAALAVAGQLAGESTVAGKALAVASTTIDTYLAAQKAYTSQLIPGDPTSLFRAQLAMGVAIAGGLANVKKIVSVKVPGTTAGGGGGVAPISAPVINSTVISRNDNGVNEIRDTISNQNQKQEPIRAYIVDKDLQNQKSKQAYYDSQSTF